jgi:hypothetical protein
MEPFLLDQVFPFSSFRGIFSLLCIHSTPNMVFCFSHFLFTLMLPSVFPSTQQQQSTILLLPCHCLGRPPPLPASFVTCLSSRSPGEERLICEFPFSPLARHVSAAPGAAVIFVENRTMPRGKISHAVIALLNLPERWIGLLSGGWIGEAPANGSASQSR